MKLIYFLLLTLISSATITTKLQAQSDDSLKYIWYKAQYGMRMPRIVSDSFSHLPYGDTTGRRPFRPGATMMHTDKVIYKWNGSNWVTAEGTATTLSNIGPGYRFVATS